METLARVRLTFRGLRARDWHVPREETAAKAEDEEAETFSATVDIRRFGQLLSAQRVQPSWFVCSESASKNDPLEIDLLSGVFSFDL